MKPILLIFWILTASACLSQYDMRFQEDSYTIDDSTFRLSGGVLNYQEPDLWCFHCEDRSMHIYRIENKDSLQDYVQNLLAPYLGEAASKRTIVTGLEAYNTERIKSDSTDNVRCQRYDEYCWSLQHIYECYLQFDDSIYHKFYVKTNWENEIINLIELPSCLNKSNSLKLLPLSKIYDIAYKDHYFKGESIRYHMELDFSEALGLFYYTLESNDYKLIDEGSNHWKSNVKQMYIDAHSGKILWRVMTEHLREWGGCLINYQVTVPPNKLTGIK